MMKGVILIFSVLNFLVAENTEQISRSQIAAYPFFTDEVRIASSNLDDDSTKLISNAGGDPLFFSREVFTEACETGICYPIQITLFWDCTGSFLGFSIPKEFPLTKAGHKEFSEFDYFQLFTLLNHPESKISKYTKKELVKVNLKKQKTADAVSGATVKVGNETLVSGAAFTCFTLWDIVNRNTENLDPKYFGETAPDFIAQEDLEGELSNLKDLSANKLALLLTQAQDEKLLRKFEIQMQLVNELEELPELQSLIISNYLSREKFLYPEVKEVFKKNKKIADCFFKMTHFG